MQLRFSPVSPFARKFRVMLREKGLLGRVQEASGVMTIDGALASDPMAQPVVLWESDERMIADPAHLLMALDGMGGGPKLLPEDEAAREKALRMLLLADGALEAGVQIRSLLPTPASEDRDYWVDRLQKSVLGGIDAAEQLSPQAEPLTIGGVAMVCALSWIDEALPGAAWKPTHPHLSALQLVLEQRPSFQDARMSGG
jgi:glutathione S-transferase